MQSDRTPSGNASHGNRSLRAPRPSLRLRRRPFHGRVGTRSGLLQLSVRVVPAIALAVFASGASSEVRGESLPPVPGEVLLKLREPNDSLALSRIASNEGAVVVKRNDVLGYVKLRLQDPDASVLDTVDRLRLDPVVAWAEPNGYYTTLDCAGAPLDPMLVDLPDGDPENQWGVYKSGLFDLWRYGRGGDPSIVIAIVDTGIDDFSDPHPDLASNVLGTGYDLVGGDTDPTDVGPAGVRGHGTHVAGIAAAASNGEGIAGVAYCSSLLIVRSMDCSAGDECPGTLEDIADGIQVAADHPADVINLSLGGSEPSHLIREAVQYAIQQGAIVVAAAGNDGQPVLSYPAGYPEVIAVGATNSDDDVADFSNWGDELDLVAPGEAIYSTVVGDDYGTKSGTSMASPFVAGVAALIVAENPAITQLEMEAFLVRHTMPLGGANAERDGAGRVQFLPLIDWSDAPPPYPAASHGLFAWEWLGDEASPELGIADPVDGDHRPNIGAPQAADGYDDGVFRASVYTLPILPPHLSEGSETFDIRMGVADPSSPRYGAEPGKSLHVDVWTDWDGDAAFESGAAAEHAIADATFDPTTWGGDRATETVPITVVDEHIWGNPLVVRSRLAYGASAGSATGPAPFGEVEDDVFINFVEEFDIDRRVHVPGVYVTLGRWDMAPDPTPWCENRGEGWLAATAHPDLGEPCNGFIEAVSVMAGPDMDWTEYTAAFIRVWYCHELFQQCGEEGDRCRIRLDRNGVKIDLGPIPIGSGTLLFDVSDLVGTDVVRVEFVEETDLPGHVSIDDLVVWAYDGEDPIAIADLSVNRIPGDRQLDLGWTAPDENLFIPSPPADDESSVHDLRYSRSPITTEEDWLRARPVRPTELTGPDPVPGPAGAGLATAFEAPSAFQSYVVAVRTMDEMTNLSALSNSPTIANAPTLGVAVAGQGTVTGGAGEIVTLDFEVTNTGDIADSYALTATDTEGWELLDLPGWMRLDPLASAIFPLRVRIAPAASDGDGDLVTLRATSLAQMTVTATGTDSVRVESDPAGLDPVPGLVASALRFAGEHPFQHQLELALDVVAPGSAFVGVYRADGRLVRRLIEGELERGTHRLSWDGRDEAGHEVASGAFYLVARAGGWTEERTVLRVR